MQKGSVCNSGRGRRPSIRGNDVLMVHLRQYNSTAPPAASTASSSIVNTDKTTADSIILRSNVKLSHNDYTIKQNCNETSPRGFCASPPEPVKTLTRATFEFGSIERKETHSDEDAGPRNTDYIQRAALPPTNIINTLVNIAGTQNYSPCISLASAQRWRNYANTQVSNSNISPPNISCNESRTISDASACPSDLLGSRFHSVAFSNENKIPTPSVSDIPSWRDNHNSTVKINCIDEQVIIEISSSDEMENMNHTTTKRRQQPLSEYRKRSVANSHSEVRCVPATVKHPTNSEFYSAPSDIDNKAVDIGSRSANTDSEFDVWHHVKDSGLIDSSGHGNSEFVSATENLETAISTNSTMYILRKSTAMNSRTTTHKESYMITKRSTRSISKGVANWNVVAISDNWDDLFVKASDCLPAGSRITWPQKLQPQHWNTKNITNIKLNKATYSGHLVAVKSSSINSKKCDVTTPAQKKNGTPMNSIEAWCNAGTENYSCSNLGSELLSSTHDNPVISRPLTDVTPTSSLRKLTSFSLTKKSELCDLSRGPMLPPLDNTITPIRNRLGALPPYPKMSRAVLLTSPARRLYDNRLQSDGSKNLVSQIRSTNNHENKVITHELKLKPIEVLRRLSRPSFIRDSSPPVLEWALSNSDTGEKTIPRETRSRKSLSGIRSGGALL